MVHGIGARAGDGVDLERAPIRYSKAEADNPVARLDEKLKRRQLKLTRDERLGYLPAVLDALEVPRSSQMLVFSKTSLQQRVIAPSTPRAIYFNDQVHVGYCQNGEVLEVAAHDANLGTAFYTLYQEAERPRFARQSDNCLQCHGGTGTRGYPGHLVRSLHCDPGGYPVYSAKGFRTDPTSPFEERWGGWYVTGRHGAMRHLGNTTFANRRDAETGGPREPGQNVTDLTKLFDTSHYLTPHSDLVALMVFEHQADMLNRLSRASLETRMALAEQEQLNRELKEPAGHAWESTGVRIRSAAQGVVEGLLFVGEAKLTDRVEGSSPFAREFTARGPRDRSLREFDLKTRLFRRPLSYLIQTRAFDQLPDAVRQPVLVRLHEILTAPKPPEGFEHLASADRRELIDIIRGTVPRLPDVWLRQGPSDGKNPAR